MKLLWYDRFTNSQFYICFLLQSLSSRVKFFFDRTNFPNMILSIVACNSESAIVSVIVFSTSTSFGITLRSVTLTHSQAIIVRFTNDEDNVDTTDCSSKERSRGTKLCRRCFRKLPHVL